VVRMSSKAASAIMVQAGLEPNFQMVCRDRNRLAMQADILGAYAHGIRNMLCLSGDHQKFGDHPGARGVFDIDSMQLIALVKQMRDSGTFLSGAELHGVPKMFIGAASNPFAEPFEWRVHRLAKKIEAGVDFIQTQCIYNIPKFKEWLKIAVDRGLTQKVHILAGITPFKSLGMARYMKSRVPGMDVPDNLIERLKGVPKEKQAEEGIRLAIEMMQELKGLNGVKGFHIMAIEWEEKVPELVKGAGLYPRPTA
ncbi:MAG TPA: 5,10-methylenetetrahydrofolate reductase, partial [Desulfobacterales bacterium]|nr:5,10-methylenetetrahydrofolate reductase [Desulfobacterales bacterium]